MLSKRTVRHGTVVFKVVNKGKLPHDFKISGHKTALIKPGKSLKFASLPEGQDPDDLVRAGGREAVNEVLAAS